MSINVLPIFEAYPIFNRISARLQGCVRSELRHIRAEDGQDLFRIAEPCTELPLIVAGRVRVSRTLRAGSREPLYIVNPGELCVLSVSCLLADLPYPALATAAGEVVGATLPKSVFQKLVDDDDLFRKEVFRSFSMRFCQLMAVIDGMPMMRMDERLSDRHIG